MSGAKRVLLISAVCTAVAFAGNTSAKQPKKHLQKEPEIEEIMNEGKIRAEREKEKQERIDKLIEVLKRCHKETKRKGYQNEEKMRGVLEEIEKAEKTKKELLKDLYKIMAELRREMPGLLDRAVKKMNENKKIEIKKTWKKIRKKRKSYYYLMSKIWRFYSIQLRTSKPLQEKLRENIDGVEKELEPIQKKIEKRKLKIRELKIKIKDNREDMRNWAKFYEEIKELEGEIRMAIPLMIKQIEFFENE
ncbi:hypothetical protein KAW38_04330 [Candidatus Micrarchaeota archaeon]|nr:hypothetical protein [Candidatus Micrarchaeota archaeon]